MSYATRHSFAGAGILTWMKGVVCPMCLFDPPVKVLHSPYLEAVCSVIENTSQILIVQWGHIAFATHNNYKSFISPKLMK
jgi:hypothetical protein